MSTTNEIDKSFLEFEEACKESKEIRNELISNLRKVIANPEMSPGPYDKAMVLQAKISVYKTLDDILKSDEAVSINKLKMKLARKDGETNGMIGAAIVETLKAFRASGDDGEVVDSSADLEKAQAELEARAKEIKEAGGKNAALVTVSEGELEVCEGQSSTDAARPDDDKSED